MTRRKSHHAENEEPTPPVEDAEGAAVDLPAEPLVGSSGPAPMSELELQLTEQRDRHLRLAAEYDNFRKRSAKERLETSSRAQAEIVSRLLDALDDLSRFADIEPATTDPMTLHKGIELVEQKIAKALTSAGLEIIDPVDQTFDPTIHEAVSTEPALSKEDDDTVSKVFQPGYRFNGQLLRPARVVVKQWNG
ncbi:MAG: nucleotide exchange factor GrpE [Gemmatimonadota bacterium]